MKKKLTGWVFTALILSLMVPFIIGCSKSSGGSTPPPEKDYAALFKNSIWTGLYKQNLTDPWAFPYSLEFVNNDSVVLRLTWDGLFSGKFKLDGNKIKLDFYNITTTATITDADTLTNFESPPNYGLQFLSGKLNKHRVQSLNNTSWRGIHPYYTGGDTLWLDFNAAGTSVLINKMTTTTYTNAGNRLRFSHGGGTFFEADYYMFLMDDNTLLGQKDAASVGNKYFIATKL